MSGQQLAEKFLGITDEEQLKELGLGTFEEFATGFKQGMDEWDPSVYRDSMNKKYEQIAEDNDIDVGQFKAYRKSTEAREGFEDDTGSQSADKWLDELESTNIEEYTEALNELAIMQTRLSRGYDTLASNWEDWNGVMTDTEASIDEINEIMPDLNDALADILNWDVADVELLPHDFAKKHWDVIQDVYNGVDGAQERLAGLAANEYVVSLDVDTEGFSTDVGNAYTTVTGWLQNMPDLEVGMTLDDTGMTTAFNALLESGAVTVEQMNNILSKIGFTPEIAYKDVEITGDHKQQIVSAGGFTKVNADGSTTWVPINNETEVDSYVGSTMQVPYIKGEKTPYTGGGGVSPKPPKDRKPGGGGGGGGSKPKKTSDSRKDKDEIVDRYKEINDQLEETQRLMKKNNTLADGLYGAKRFAKLKENIKLMEQENKQLKEKYQLTLDYLEADADALQKAAAEAGVSFNIGADGNITNYTQQMTALWEERERLLDSFGAEMDEKEQERLEDFDKRVEALKKAYEKYEKTLDEKKDAEEEHLAKILEIQTAYYDLLNEELEVKISLNDDALSTLEYYLSKM